MRTLELVGLGSNAAPFTLPGDLGQSMPPSFLIPHLSSGDDSCLPFIRMR